MDRRTFLWLGAGGLAAACLPAPVTAAASDRLVLWPGSPPGGGGPVGPVQTNARGAISHIAEPVIEVFAPDHPNGTAMLIAAGGGYKRIERATEALPAARWLNARGITAFVLDYRLPGEGWSAGALAPLQDAQRALRLIRARAEAFSIRPDRVGVMGFSAGGHLLGLAATRATFASYRAIDAVDALSARPDMAALIYPVITLLPPYQHTSTRRVLVGDHPAQALAAEWSVQTHVTADSPPFFLVQAADDPISNPYNTVLMKAACDQAGVAAERLQLESGGHGFGMGAGAGGREWRARFASWLQRQHGV
jgi:acetyl esterase/lipase